MTMSEALRQLQIDGYVILPGLLSAPEVEEIRRALTPLLARQPGRRASSSAPGPADSTSSWRKLAQPIVW